MAALFFDVKLVAPQETKEILRPAARVAKD